MGEGAHRVLVFGEGISLAHVTRALLVAKALKAQGHEVLFATSEGKAQWVSTRGFDPAVVATSDPGPLYDRLRQLKPMYLRDELEASVDSDVNLIRGFKPDLVLGDCRNSLRISSELTEVPYAAIINANCGPWFGGAIRSPQSFPLNRVLGKRFVDRYLMPIVGKLGQDVVCRRLSGPFADVQADRGCEQRCRDIRDLFVSPDINLIADLPDLMPSKPMPEGCHYVGPLFWGDDAAFEASTMDVLNSLDQESPLIYLTLGSTGDSAGLAGLWEELGGLPYHFLVSGWQSDEAISVPENVTLAGFVSAPKVLERASLVVCHGGNGSIYQALAQGVPLLTMPTFFDQEIQSDQVEEYGVGSRIRQEESLSRAIQRVLALAQEQPCRTKLTQLRGRIDAQRSAQESVRVVTGWLESGQSELRRSA